MMSLHSRYDVICVICSGLAGPADRTCRAVLSGGSATAGCVDLACSSGLAGGLDRGCPLTMAAGPDAACPLAVAGAGPAGGADRAQAGSGGGAGLAGSAYPGIHLSTSARNGTSQSSWHSTPRPAASTRWMSTCEGGMLSRRSTLDDRNAEVCIVSVRRERPGHAGSGHSQGPAPARAHCGEHHRMAAVSGPRPAPRGGRAGVTGDATRLPVGHDV